MTRKQRGHGHLPAGYTWRDGRPRWIPAPALRKAGWKGMDLRDAKGVFLAKGEAITAAEKIVAAVAAWRAGRAVPAELACAPALARVVQAGPRTADPRSIGALLDAHCGVKASDGSWRVAPSNEFAQVKNQADRRSKLSRFVDMMAGYPVQPKDRKDPAYLAVRAQILALSIDVLAPPVAGQAGDDFLYDAYWKARKEVGEHMAHGMMAEISAWLGWCVKPRRAIPVNWALSVDRNQPDGRIRVGSWDELAALITSADALGWPSIGDSVILGVDLSWSQADRLNLTWPQLQDDRIGTNRRKTGRRGETKLLATLGLPRVEAIRRRQEAILGPGCRYTHVLVCEETGKPWTPSQYGKAYRQVRAHAALACPSVATLRDQDLRDTAVTIAYEAELTLPEIASRTLHSLERIGAILDRHYGEIGRRVGDNAADKLDAFLAKIGMRL